MYAHRFKLTAVLIFVLILLAFSCHAESQIPEILFRGMPWMQDVDTFVNALRSDLIDPEYDRLFRIVADIYSPSTIDSYVSDTEPVNYVNFDTDDCLYTFNINGVRDDIMVGGYPLSGVSGFAFAGINGSSVCDDPCLSRVVYVSYYFYESDIGSIDNAFNDFSSKLDQLYGRPYKVDLDGVYKLCSWRGANGTYVALRGSSSSLHISYGLCNIQELCDEMREIRAGSLDGL